MKSRVLCLLADGFEEIEFVVPVDLLRRAGIEVLVSSLKHEVVTGRSGIRVIADGALGDQAIDAFQMLLVPGGPGVNELRRDERVMMLVREFAARGKFLAAICAAPLILHDAGLLETARFCAHASTRSELPNGLDERLVIDNKLITSRGAGTAIDFGLALVAQLAGAPAAEKVAADIMV